MKNSMRFGSALVLVLSLAVTGAADAKKKKADIVNAPQAISAKDKATGQKAHPDLLNEFGGLYAGPQAAYVTKIGQRVALQSGLATGASDFTFSLLNSPVNNAFAIPGGYVYVTRQLMALMNNEAELASVIGHENGHVTARHSAKRNKRATLGGILAAAATVGGALLGGGQGAQLGQQIGGTIAQGFVMKYSQSQEYQADDLGINYLLKAGYDTLAASTMLASLAAQTSLDLRRAGKSEKSLPEWASTHPDPASRVIRAQKTATSLGGTGREKNADAFLSQLDGMLYDDDPAQGVVDGQTFKHRDLKLTFTAPDGYSMNNGANAVTVAGTGGQAQFTNGGAYSGDMNAYVAAAFKAIGGDTPLNYGTVQRTTINAIPVGYATASTTTSSGQQVRVTVYGYEFSGNRAFAVLSISPTTVSDPFTSLYGSVRRLSDSEAAAIKARKIEIVKAKSSDTVDGLASRMAYADYRQERFRVLNGLSASAVLESGRRYKIVTN